MKKPSGARPSWHPGSFFAGRPGEPRVAPRAAASGRRALPVLALLAGCAPQDGRPLEELERLAWVPADVCRIEGTPRAFENPRPLLVDRFEVTREAWRARGVGLAQGAGAELLVRGTDPEGGRGTWPASGMTLAEARRFAALRGMRLLTAGEWLRVAAGPGAQSFPWEPVLFRSVANTVELGLGRPVPVGTFERGRTPLSTYDMLGNVWEWVEGRVPYPDDPPLEARAWAMGGSYLSRLRPLFEPDWQRIVRFYQRDLDPAHRSLDVGLRCCADAEAYLWSHARSFGDGPSARERLLAVGRGFGPAASGLLERLALRPGAPKSLAVLLEGARQP